MPKCCAYGIPNDPEGEVVRFTLCTPDNEPCPKFTAYQNLTSWAVATCEDCKLTEPPAIRPRVDIRAVERFLDEIARAPQVLERLRNLGLIPELPPELSPTPGPKQRPR
jgi:hypothetical protein